MEVNEILRKMSELETDIIFPHRLQEWRPLWKDEDES